MSIVYKIQRVSDGLFATGSTWPRFNKYGKGWTQRHHLLHHLKLVRRKLTGNLYPYNDCKVVELHLIPEKAMLVEDFFNIHTTGVLTSAESSAA